MWLLIVGSVLGLILEITGNYVPKHAESVRVNCEGDRLDSYSVRNGLAAWLPCGGSVRMCSACAQQEGRVPLHATFTESPGGLVLTPGGWIGDNWVHMTNSCIPVKLPGFIWVLKKGCGAKGTCWIKTQNKPLVVDFVQQPDGCSDHQLFSWKAETPSRKTGTNLTSKDWISLETQIWIPFVFLAVYAICSWLWLEKLSRAAGVVRWGCYFVQVDGNKLCIHDQQVYLISAMVRKKADLPYVQISLTSAEGMVPQMKVALIPFPVSRAVLNTPDSTEVDVFYQGIISSYPASSAALGNVKSE